MNILHYLFNHKSRIADLKAKQSEIKRQQERMNAAYDLHHDVLRQYGYEAWLKLASPQEIMEDDKTICVVNYLDI